MPARCRTEGGSARPSTYASVSVQFLRAVVVVLVIAVLVWIYFVVVIFFSHMYAQKVFFVLFTGVLNTITHKCKRGIEAGVSSWSMVGSCFQLEGFVWEKGVSLHFAQGVDVYVLCVRVYAYTHTLHVGYVDVSPGVRTRHMESLEEIQMYYSDSIHICHHTVYEVHMYIYMLGYR